MEAREVVILVRVALEEIRVKNEVYKKNLEVEEEIGINLEVEVDMEMLEVVVEIEMHLEVEVDMEMLEVVVEIEMHLEVEVQVEVDSNTQLSKLVALWIHM